MKGLYRGFAAGWPVLNAVGRRAGVFGFDFGGVDVACEFSPLDTDAETEPVFDASNDESLSSLVVGVVALWAAVLSGERKGL